MANLTSTTNNAFDDEEEYFVFPVPEGGEEDDELVIPILSEKEAHAILDADEQEDE
jgi:hypothetical protein